MGRKLGLLVAMFVLCLPASAPAQDTASTALNILPSGQSEDASAPGATREAEMYNALTPLRDNITDAQLPNYFKSEALDPGNTIVRTETIPAGRASRSAATRSTSRTSTGRPTTM